MLTGTFARLSGRPEATPSAEHAIYRYETSFGGGKTHGLIALWHLAAGARPANVAEFVDPGLLPPACQAAAVVGDTLDPVNGLRGDDGVTTWTLWGEIARQLGPAAWELVAASDEARTSCGKQVWLEVFGDTPTVIVIDEIAQYLRRLGTSGDERVRNLAGATIDGLKVLFEAATAAPAVRIVFTLATGTTAFRTETADVARTLSDVEAQRLQQEAADVMQRPMGAVGRPADDNEIGYILRRRLFADVDDAAANDARRGVPGALQRSREPGRRGRRGNRRSRGVRRTHRHCVSLPSRADRMPRQTHWPLARVPAGPRRLEDAGGVGGDALGDRS